MHRKKKAVKKSSSKFKIRLQMEHVDWSKVERIFTEDRKSLYQTLIKNKLNDPRVKDILKLLAGGTVIALSFAFPTLPMAVAPFIVDSKRYRQSQFGQALKRLRKQKLVEIVHQNGELVVRITEEGRMRALRYKLYEMEVKRPKSWDRKWRMVIFDIPEKYKRMREIFRNHLKLMEFYPLQKSVWVHPFPCFDEVEFLRQIYHVGVDVTYVVAERIEGTEDIKTRYDLDNR